MRKCHIRIEFERVHSSLYLRRLHVKKLLQLATTANDGRSLLDRRSSDLAFM